MKEQFIPYELALKLKELGFDELCFGYYNHKKELLLATPSHNCKFLPFYYKNSEVSKMLSRIFSGDTEKNKYVSTPLWQQAFDWLLKKHNLYGVIIPTVTMHWTFKTMTVVEGIVEVPPYNHVDANDYSTIEEARQACLEKLIELCKEKIT